MKTEFSITFQREVGSAAAEKGILAVAAACCDASAVGLVQKYLKEWYGYRPAQCKALIAMLSTIDHPSATQYLLSIANRFRTKGIREEAEKYVNALAERKGWTLDELADRTLPTAGLGDDGTLELSFGSRQFQLRVTPNLEAVLTDAEGKIIKGPAGAAERRRRRAGQGGQEGVLRREDRAEEIRRHADHAAVRGDVYPADLDGRGLADLSHGPSADEVPLPAIGLDGGIALTPCPSPGRRGEPFAHTPCPSPVQPSTAGGRGAI